MNTWREADATAREFLPQMDQLRWNEDHMIFAGIVMSGRAPADQGLFFGVALVASAVMSSAFFLRRIGSAGPDVVR
jgi:hypothetical protein